MTSLKFTNLNQFKMRSRNNKKEYEPIVAGLICPTRPLTKLTDILLKSFLLHVRSKTTLTSYQNVQEKSMKMSYY